MIPSKYEEVLLQVKTVLNNVEKVCLTTDCWTSLADENYTAVTAHFVTDDFL